MILVFSYILLVLVGSFMGLAESGDIDKQSVPLQVTLKEGGK
jgi:hypothetical protein